MNADYLRLHAFSQSFRTLPSKFLSTDNKLEVVTRQKKNFFFSILAVVFNSDYTVPKSWEMEKIGI